MSELCKEIVCYTFNICWLFVLDGVFDSCGDGLQYKQTGH